MSIHPPIMTMEALEDFERKLAIYAPAGGCCETCQKFIGIAHTMRELWKVADAARTSVRRSRDVGPLITALDVFDKQLL